MKREVIKKVENSLPVIVRSGKVDFGATYVLWALRNTPEKVKAIVIARNTPPGFLSKLQESIEASGRKIPLILLSKTNMELGDLCGRPHSVSSLVIYDFGTAPISEDDLNE